MPRVLSPTEMFYWRTFIFVLTAFSVWICPVASAFYTDCTPLVYIDVGFSCLFLIDIGFQFFVAFKNEATGSLELNRRRIAKKYLKTWFALDLFSAIPILAWHRIPIKGMQILFFLLHVYRWKTVHCGFNKFEKYLKINFYLARCIKLAWAVIVNGHTGGCLLYYIAILYQDPERSWVAGASKNFFQKDFGTKYTTSVYLSMSTFTTVGYGDLHAMNNGERVTTILFMVWNLGLTGYVIGHFTNLIAHSISKTHKYRDDITVASRVCKRGNVTGQLQDRFLAHVTFEHKVNVDAVYEQRIVDGLPKSLRSAIFLQQYTRVVRNAYIFREVSTEFVDELVPEMKLLFLPPGEDVVSDFYLIITGSLELIGQRDGVESVFETLDPGCPCGESYFIFSKPPVFRIRANKLSRVLKVERHAFFNIVNSRVSSDGAAMMRSFVDNLKLKRPEVRRHLIPAHGDIVNLPGDTNQSLMKILHDGDVIFDGDDVFGYTRNAVPAIDNPPE